MRFSAYFPRQSMHPLLRALLIVAGAAVMAFMIIFGAMAMLVLGAAGAVALAMQRWRMKHGSSASPSHSQPTQSNRVLEGEYTVVEHPSRRP